MISARVSSLGFRISPPQHHLIQLIIHRQRRWPCSHFHKNPGEESFAAVPLPYRAAWESIQCLVGGSSRLGGTAPCSKTAKWKARTSNFAPKQRSASTPSSLVLSWPSL